MLRFAVLGVVVLAVAGCGSSHTPLLAPAPASVAWTPQFLGFPADVMLTWHPQMSRMDPYWGNLANRSIASVMQDRGADPIAQWGVSGMSGARQADLYVTFRDPMRLLKGKDDDGFGANTIGYIIVVYGSAPPSDPSQLRSSKGETIFQTTRLPSGATMWTPNARLVSDTRGIYPSLFVTLDGAWIAADQSSAQRVAGILARTPSAPPPLQSAPDLLIGAYSDFRSLGFVQSATNDTTAKLLGNAQRGSIALRSGTGTVEAFVEYLSSDDAKRTESTIESTCETDPNQCAVDSRYFAAVKPDRDGNRLYVTMQLSNSLLRSIQSYQP